MFVVSHATATSPTWNLEELHVLVPLHGFHSLVLEVVAWSECCLLAPLKNQTNLQKKKKTSVSDAWNAGVLMWNSETQRTAKLLNIIFYRGFCYLNIEFEGKLMSLNNIYLILVVGAELMYVESALLQSLREEEVLAVSAGTLIKQLPVDSTFSPLTLWDRAAKKLEKEFLYIPFLKLCPPHAFALHAQIDEASHLLCLPVMCGHLLCNTESVRICQERTNVKISRIKGKDGNFILWFYDFFNGLWNV